MDWILKFPRAKEVYDGILSSRDYANAPAISVLKQRLDDAGVMRGEFNLWRNQTNGAFTSGSATAGVASKHRYHNQTRDVGAYAISITDAADHLTAALAHFSFHTLVSGCVSGDSISIDSVGIYARDSYDFNGSQTSVGPFAPGLGVWDFDDMEFDGIGELFVGSGYGTTFRITNKHFRYWRTFIGNGKGGDFIVFSDLKITRLND